jgi:hypothetical protein
MSRGNEERGYTYIKSLIKGYGRTASSIMQAEITEDTVWPRAGGFQLLQSGLSYSHFPHKKLQVVSLPVYANLSVKVKLSL